MSGEAVDYLIGLIITGIVAISAIVVVPNMTYVSLLSVNQQQLRNVAMDTLKTMLLDVGYPHAWGSLQNFSNSSLQRFGLALDKSSSFYVLDPQKVSRLLLDYPAGHLDYHTIRSRMNLQGYGFNFRILAPFSVTINGGQPIPLETMRTGVPVVVLFNDGGPIYNAAVRTEIMYMKGTVKQPKDQPGGYWSSDINNRTNVFGRCTIACTDSDFQTDVSDFVAIFYVTVSNLSTVMACYMATGTQRVASTSIVGDTVTIWIPPLSENKNARRVIQNIFAVTPTDATLLYLGGDSTEDKFNNGAGYDFWFHSFPELFYEDVLFLVFTIRTSLGAGMGDTLLLYMTPRPNWLGARIEAYGDPAARGARTVVKVQRDIIISSMSYVAELLMWKESP